MKNTLKNIVLGTTLAAILYFAGCKKNPTNLDSRLPKAGTNQSLILHPDYLRGTSSLGYTLLTDIDYNGSWDIAEKVHIGYTFGDADHIIFCKRGFGPGRDLEESIKVKTVDPNFFEPYQ